MNTLLRVSNIHKSFGGLTAVDKLSFDVAESEIVGLVGPNGSGKSTTLNVLSGIIPPDSGSMLMQGKSISGFSPHKISRAGIGRTFQNLQLFNGLTVVENVMVGSTGKIKSNLFDIVFRSHRSVLEERRNIEKAQFLLERVGLSGFGAKSPSSLSYGQRRLLEVARALASDPQILMLDEPCAGLSKEETDQLAGLIRDLRTDGLSTIVIEHNMRFVMGLVDRMVVLNFGSKIAEGSPEEIRVNDLVIATYLGGNAHA